MSEVGGSQGYIVRKKEVGELKDQVSQAEGALGTSINLPSKNGSLYEVSGKDLKEQFPVRYDAYLIALRAARQGREIPEDQQEAVSRILTPLNNLDSYIKRHHEGEKTLRDRQQNVFEDIREHLEKGEKEGYVKLPTGFGKSVLFSEIAEAMDVKTLIVVPTKILLEDAEEKIHEFAPDLKYGKVYSEAKEFGKQVTVTTYDSLQINLDNGNFKPEDFDLLILDEAHKALSEGASQAVKKFDSAIKLGLTATPEYSKDKQLSTLLTNEIHSMKLPEAIKDGLLSSVSVYLVKTSVDIGNIKVTSGGNYDDDDLEKALNVISRNEAAVQLYEKSFKGEGCTVYCLSIEHAKKMAEMFSEKGLKAAAIYGIMPRVERDDILKRYKNGEIDVLCNANLLIEGFDVARTNICINLRPTRSKVVAEQRAGRALRLDKNNPDKMAYVIDFVDTYPKEGKQNPVLFSEILGAAQITHDDEVEDVRTRNSENTNEEKGERRIQHIDIEGIEVIVDAQEIMQITNLYNFEEKNIAPLPPNGWMNVAQLEGRLAIAQTTLSRRLKSMTLDASEFGEYRSITGTVIYYAPSVAERLREVVADKPPEGWMNANQLDKLLGLNRVTIIKRLQGVLVQEEFGEYRSPGGGMTTYYAPSVVEKLRETIPENAPEGWMTANQLIILFNTTTVLKILQNIRLAHEEHGEYRTKSGRVTYYAPSVVEKLRKELSTSPPEGWVTMSYLAKQFGTSHDYRFRKRLIDINLSPEEYSEYKSGNGSGKTTYYAPSVVEKLRETIPENAPEGWMNLTELTRRLGLKNNTVVKIKLDKVNLDTKEYGEYKSGKGTIIYYAPSVVEKLRETIPENAPEGWMSASHLSREFDASIETLKKKLQEIQIAPEEFGEYRSITGTVIYYAPSVAERLREVVADKPPEGWMNANQLASNLGLDRRVTVKLLQDMSIESSEKGNYRGATRIIMYYAPSVLDKLQKKLE